MVSSPAPTVDAYMALLDADARGELAGLRERIRAALPEAREIMRHGMACYVDGRDELVAAFAAQKNNLAFYACDLSALERFRDRLPASALGKACVRFKRLQALPDDLVDSVLAAAAARMSEQTRH